MSTPGEGATHASHSGLPDESGVNAVTFLTPGTAVSAKYRGAYCEATVEQVDLRFRLRVQLKGHKINGQNTVSIDQTGLVTGEPTMGSEVTVRIQPAASGGNVVERRGSVTRVVDTSLYTVVFDDGDQRTLRRTQLVIKGERHFKESESLDCLPLTNPEQFRQPVIDRRKHRSGDEDDEADADESDDAKVVPTIPEKSTKPTNIDTPHGTSSQISREVDGKKESGATKHTGAPRTSGPLSSTVSVTQKKIDSGSVTVTSPRATSTITNPITMDEGKTKSSSDAITAVMNTPKPFTCVSLAAPYKRLLGRLVLVDMPLSGKETSTSLSSSHNVSSNASLLASETASKRRFTPGLVVLPSAMPSIDLRPTSTSAGNAKSTKLLLVRSFRDNRFFPVSTSHLKRLKRPAAVELAHAHPALRTAFERALLWLDRYELPSPWGENAMHQSLGTTEWKVAKRKYRQTLAVGAVSSKSRVQLARKRLQQNKKKTTTITTIKGKKASPPTTTKPTPPGPSSPRMNRLESRGLAIGKHNTSTPRKAATAKLLSLASRKRARLSGTLSTNNRDDRTKRPKLKPAQTSGPVSPVGRPPRASTGVKVSNKKKANRSNSSIRSPLGSFSSDDVTNNDDDDSDGNSEEGEVESDEDSSSESSPESSSSSDSDSSSTHTSSSSSADFEARDRWIAQLYRFMDEGGTPINKAPSLANKDLDLYKLYKLVRELGGFHRVTAQFKWGYIYSKLGLPHHFAAGPRNLQAAFRRYLYPLDDVSRKLGTQLHELPLDRPRHPAVSSASAVTRTPTATAHRASLSTPPSKAIAAKSAEDRGKSVKPTATIKDTEAISPCIVPEPSPPVLSPPNLVQPSSSPSEDRWLTTTSTAGSGEAGPSRLMRHSPSSAAAAIAPSLSVVLTREKEAASMLSEKRATSSLHAEQIGSAVKSKSTESPAKTQLPSGATTPPSEIKRGTVPHSIFRHQPLFIQLSAELDKLADKPSLDNINRVIPIGSRVRVRCGDRVAYEARVLKHIRPQPSVMGRATTTDDAASAIPAWPGCTELQYRVHYMGWNTRHDEVVARSRIISVIEWARPTDSDRPPSCSSLNLVVQEPRRHFNSATATNKNSAPKSSSSANSTSSATKTSKNTGTKTLQRPGKQQSKGDQTPKLDDSGLPTLSRGRWSRGDSPNAAAEDEDDAISDQSQTTETASDIVTTMAPMVRRRRFMFGNDNPLRQHPRHASAVLRRGARALQNKLLRDVNNSKSVKTVKPEPEDSATPSLAAKRSRLPSTSESDKPPDPVVVKPTPAKLAKTGTTMTTAVAVAAVEPKGQKSLPTAATKTVPSKPDVQATRRGKMNQATVKGVQSGPGKMQSKPTTNTSGPLSVSKAGSGSTDASRVSPATRKLGADRHKLKPMCKKLTNFRDRHLKRTPLRKVPRPSAATDKPKATTTVVSSSSSDSEDETKRPIATTTTTTPVPPKFASTRKTDTRRPSLPSESQEVKDRARKRPPATDGTRKEAPQSVTSSSSQSSNDDGAESKRVAPKSKVIAGRDAITPRIASGSLTTKSKAEVQKSTPSISTPTPIKQRRLDSLTLTADKMNKSPSKTPRNSASTNTTKPTARKPDVAEAKAKATPTISKTTHKEVGDSKSKRSVTSSSESSDDTGSGSSSSSESDEDDEVVKKPPKLSPSAAAQPRFKPDTIDRSRPLRSARSPQRKGNASEEEDGGTEASDTDSDQSSSDEFAAMDALPRLTRSQHRQLLGDTPPGAALQTASPVGSNDSGAAITGLGICPIATTPVGIRVDRPLDSVTVEESGQPSLEPEVVCEKTEIVAVDAEQDVKLSPSAPTLIINEDPSPESPHTTEVCKPEDEPPAVTVESKEKSPISTPKRHVGLRPRTRTRSEMEQPKLDKSTKKVTTTEPDVKIERPEVGDESLLETVAVTPVDEVVDDEDGESSVHTMSTDPMKDLPIDFTMSPTESTGIEDAPVCRTRSGSSSSDGSRSSNASNCSDSGSTVADRVKRRGASEDMSDDVSVCPGDKSGVARRPDTAAVDNEDAQEDEDEGERALGGGRSSATKSRTRSERMTSSSLLMSDMSSRKMGKRGLLPTPNRPLAPCKSPQYEASHPSRSPLPAVAMGSMSSGTTTNIMGVTQSTKIQATPASVLQTVRLAPAQRRFGGPFIPISGFDEMNTETRCQFLQERMHRILQAWRSAKQYLKDIDHQRNNRSRRPRTRQPNTTTSGSTPTTTPSSLSGDVQTVANGSSPMTVSTPGTLKLFVENTFGGTSCIMEQTASPLALP